MIVKVRDGMLEFVERNGENVESVIGSYSGELGCKQLNGIEAIDVGSMSGLVDGYVQLAKKMNCAVLDKGIEMQDVMQNAFQAGVGLFW